MKFAVHWPPSVYVCTPGWTAAVEAGAHADAVEATASIPAMATSAVASIKRSLTTSPLGSWVSRYAAGCPALPEAALIRTRGGWALKQAQLARRPTPPLGSADVQDAQRPQAGPDHPGRHAGVHGRPRRLPVLVSRRAGEGSNVGGEEVHHRPRKARPLGRP